MSVRSVWFIKLFKSTFFMDPLSGDLSIVKNEVLKSPTIIILLISPFTSITIFLKNVNVFLLNLHKKKNLDG